MKDRFETHGDFSWCELLTNDVEGAKAFYREVFGWEMKERELEEGPYTIIKAGDRQVGGIMKMPAQVPHWESYVTVDDVDEVARKIVENGGRLLVPPTDIPGTGRFCTFQDPQGAALSAITYEKRSG